MVAVRGCILKGEDIRVCEGVCVSDLGVGTCANILCMPKKRKKGRLILAATMFFFCLVCISLFKYFVFLLKYLH